MLYGGLNKKMTNNKHMMNYLKNDNDPWGALSYAKMYIEDLKKQLKEKDEMIEKLTQFIKNGYDTGYIEINPFDKKDTAYKTLIYVFGEERSNIIIG